MDRVAALGAIALLVFFGIAWFLLEFSHRKRIIKEKDSFIEVLGNMGFVSVNFLHKKLQDLYEREGKQVLDINEVIQVYKILMRVGFVDGYRHKVTHNWYFNKKGQQGPIKGVSN